MHATFDEGSQLPFGPVDLLVHSIHHVIGPLVLLNPAVLHAYDDRPIDVWAASTLLQTLELMG